jgi:hypothetical protein
VWSLLSGWCNFCGIPLAAWALAMSSGKNRYVGVSHIIDAARLRKYWKRTIKSITDIDIQIIKYIILKILILYNLVCLTNLPSLLDIL